MANKENEKDKIIEIDLGGVKEKMPIFDEPERISELEKIQLGQNKIKQIQTSDPTYKPKNWYEQISLTANNLWVNINNVWNNFINANGTTAYTATGAGFKDEDNMVSDSATATASQQSIKKYVDDNKGIGSVLEDTTPQLGGNLDLNGFNLDFPTNDIEDCLDEDDMASNASAKLASQQSIKAYVDNETAKIQIFTASDTLQWSADTERTETSNTYVLKKQIDVYFAGQIRVKFDLKSSFGTWQAYGQIYINGVAVGTERNNSTTSYVTYSEDFYVKRGDFIQLYATDKNSDATVYIQNFRIYYTKTEVAVDSAVITD